MPPGAGGWGAAGAASPIQREAAFFYGLFLRGHSADELRRALAAGVRMPRVESLFRELAARTAQHFAHEEREMKATGYAHGAWHRRQHAAANKELARTGRRIQRGDREAATLLLDFVARSLTGHIAVADRMLNAHLRNYQRARAAKAG